MAKPNKTCHPYFEAVVGPATKLHGTALLVKGKPGDVNLARRLQEVGLVPFFKLFNSPRKKVKYHTVRNGKTLKIPGGRYEQRPVSETITLVGNDPSNFSSALSKQKGFSGRAL